MIVAGEMSGDLHGSEIARYVRRTDQSIRYIGMGSQKMREAGVDILFDCAGIAVVGLWEVLTHWPDIKRAMRTLKKHIVQAPPDLLLLIDYQEFNLQLAHFAKQQGVKVLFYVSPQLWAWRKGRIKKFVNRIDMMAVIFPFEVKYFEAANIPVRYVGHPLCNKVSANSDRVNTRNKYGLNPDQPLVGLLPGSRQAEVKKILPIQLETAQLLTNQIPEVQFILPLANSSLRAMVQENIVKHNLNITLCEKERYNAIHACNAAVVASGTATLEVALLGVPMAVVYSVAPLTYAILSRLISVPHIGLVNIVAGQQVAKEFVQTEAKPVQIAEEISKLLLDVNYAERARRETKLVKDKLGTIDGIEGIGQLALKLLDE